MEAWQDLDAVVFGKVYNAVWDRFEEAFQFRPGEQPGIVEPVPSLTYSISAGYGSDEAHQNLVSDLHVKMLSAFRRCTQPEQRLYALDWQHVGFWLYPHEPFLGEAMSGWQVPVFPDGDYYIFLSEDFSFGTFGHPWEESLCVFGQSLLNALQTDEPELFNRVIRLNGRAT